MFATEPLAEEIRRTRVTCLTEVRFSRIYLEAILKITGDDGGQELLERSQDLCKQVYEQLEILSPSEMQMAQSNDQLAMNFVREVFDRTPAHEQEKDKGAEREL